jgi:glycosyltransferase involved in cell wall biosynthesis
MRIIQVNSQFNGGGVDTQTLELCAGLTDLGHEVMLVMNDGARWRSRAEAIPGLRIESMAGGKVGQGLRLRGLAESFGAQVLHAHHGRDYWTTGLATKLAKHKPAAVLTRHLMTRLSATSARWLLWLGHVTAVSRAVYDNLAGELHGDLSRMRLIYAGIDTQRYHPDAAVRAAERARLGWGESEVVYAVIGGITLPDGKGQIEFVEAGARLIREQPQVRLLIVGEGTLVPTLKARVAELGLESSILFTGFSQQVERVCNAIDVLVHPAVSTEALGLVIWEAMAAARPIVASRLHGIPETFVDPDHGRLVRPRDIDDLYAAMRLFAGDRALRERCGSAARQYLLDQGYTRAGQARRFADYYQELAAGELVSGRKQP